MHRIDPRWLLALSGIVGILALFFPFAAGLGVADGWDWFGRMILPVVTFPFLILAGNIAQLATDKPLRWLNQAGYLSAVLFGVIAISDMRMSGLDEILFVAVFIPIPAFCIALGNIAGVDKESDAKGLVALQSTYAVHLSFYLALFFGDSHNIGYWLALLALLVALAQIAVVVAKKWWVVSLYAPAAILWAVFLSDI